MFNNLVLALKNPRKALVSILCKIGFIFPDKIYLKIVYRLRVGKKLHLNNPQTFNEKLQWLKLYDRKPIYTTMVDKYAVKNYVAERIGPEYIIPTIGVWNKFDDIDFAELPDQFVLKCTHDSGGLVVCRDKGEINMMMVRKKINKSLKTNYFIGGREWPYKNVPRRIIAEKYMEDETGELRDFKFFCFDGIPKAMFIATERSKDGEEVKFDFYDMNCEHLPFTQGHPNSSQEIKLPVSFEEMKALAMKLSNGFPQLRVDFYEINGKVYFGELTFSHFSGMTPFNPESWDKIFGDWIILPELQ